MYFPSKHHRGLHDRTKETRRTADAVEHFTFAFRLEESDRREHKAVHTARERQQTSSERSAACSTKNKRCRKAAAKDSGKNKALFYSIQHIPSFPPLAPAIVSRPPLQEDVFADKEYRQYIHKRCDLLRLTADHVNDDIRDNADSNALGNTVHKRHCKQT